MQIITPQEVTPEILSLFNMDNPTMPRAFNILEGVCRGQIIVDDPARPTWAVVREAIYGSLYFGGRVDSSLLAKLVGEFRQTGEVGTGCWLDDPLNEMIPPDPDYDGFTLYFTERARDVPLQPLIEQLPPNYVFTVRDQHLLPRSFDYESTLASFGSVENVLKHTIGVMLLDGDTILCEAATGAPTHGRIEVGVTTAREHRQRGYAGMACAKLIELCEAQGYSTWWDCAKQNTPSVRLARKLGYHTEREYRYVWWNKRQFTSPD